jgi:hypothetical protein
VNDRPGQTPVQPPDDSMPPINDSTIDASLSRLHNPLDKE